MRAQRRGAPVPILMYHNVADPPRATSNPTLYVRPAQFARHLRLLRALGYRGVSMAGAMPYLRGERTGRVAVLTFDDGYADNVENALPLLKRHGFEGTCYVASGAIGRYNVWDAELLGVRKPTMTAAQLREWHDAGMEVGAHTRSHPRLSRCSDAEIAREVAGSRRDLEDRLGAAVAQFCYPYGDYDRRVVRAVRDAGFDAATTLRRGRARPGDDPYQLRRVVVRGTDALHLVLLKLLTPYEDRRGRGHLALTDA